MSALYIISFVTISVALIVYNSRQPLSRVRAAEEESDSSVIVESSPLTGQRGTWFTAKAIQS